MKLEYDSALKPKELTAEQHLGSLISVCSRVTATSGRAIAEGLDARTDTGVTQTHRVQLLRRLRELEDAIRLARQVLDRAKTVPESSSVRCMHCGKSYEAHSPSPFLPFNIHDWDAAHSKCGLLRKHFQVAMPRPPFQVGDRVRHVDVARKMMSYGEITWIGNVYALVSFCGGQPPTLILISEIAHV